MSRVRDTSGNGGRFGTGMPDPLQPNESVEGVPTAKRSDNMGLRATYGCGAYGIAPAAATTDLFDINNPAGSNKLIRVSSVTVSGVITSAAHNLVQLAKRSTNNSAGTASTLAPISHDSRDLASVAILNAYTANPTLGTLVGNIHFARLAIAPASNALDRILFTWGWLNEKAIVLLPGEALGVNFNGATLGAGAALDIDWLYMEENL